MKTFKEYINETIRTPERAVELIKNLAKRQKRYGFKPSPTSLYGKQAMKSILPSKPFETTPEDRHDYGDLSNRFSHKVPMHKIYTIQDELNKSGVIAKTDGEQTEPLLYYKPNRDLYSAGDGNHGLAALKAKGVTSPKCTVIYPINHPGPKK